MSSKRASKYEVKGHRFHCDSTLERMQNSLEFPSGRSDENEKQKQNKNKKQNPGLSFVTVSQQLRGRRNGRDSQRREGT